MASAAAAEREDVTARQEDFPDQTPELGVALDAGAVPDLPHEARRQASEAAIVAFRPRGRRPLSPEPLLDAHQPIGRIGDYGMDADTLVYQATKGNPVVATIQLHIHRHAPPQNYPEIISADEEQQDCPTTTSDYPTRPFIRTSERSGAGRRIARRTSRKTWPSPPPSRWPNSRGQRTSRPTRRSYQRLRCRRLRGRSQQTPLPCIKAIPNCPHELFHDTHHSDPSWQAATANANTINI